MNFQTDHLSAFARSLPNFSLLEGLLAGFKPENITGFATLGETAFLRHPRLIFYGTGQHSETVLYGPSFSPMLLEESNLASELREIVGEFFKQIHELEEPEVSASAPEIPTDRSGLILRQGSNGRGSGAGPFRWSFYNR